MHKMGSTGGTNLHGGSKGVPGALALVRPVSGPGSLSSPAPESLIIPVFLP